MEHTHYKRMYSNTTNLLMVQHCFQVGYSMVVFLLLITDVIQIDKTAEFFRLMYDVKGRFTIHRITAEESKVSATQYYCSNVLPVRCCLVCT